jgi:hypothetical protein
VIERNDLDLEPESVLQALQDDERAVLIDQVGDAIEPRAVTHTLTGWKVRRPPRTHTLRTSASTLRTLLRLRTRLRSFRARAMTAGGGGTLELIGPQGFLRVRMIADQRRAGATYGSW